MDELVRRLTDNYFDASFDYDKPNSELEQEYARVFGSSRDFQAARRSRNIVIVGAGASYAAFGGDRFPLAKDAIGRIREYLGVQGLLEALRYSERGARAHVDRLTEEEERAELLTRVDFPQHDFESQLAIYSKFYTPRQVRGAIQSIYNHRYHPHLIFETIAHLLKHRFVDVVISYNFDELLDQAIEEELTESEYRRIISDGDTDDLASFVVDEQLKVPLYIKPHGTARSKSSLRFTKDDYLGIPSDLQEFTRRILHGDTRDDPETQRERYRVNLICVGFAFSSIELLHALRKHRDLTVFHVNTHRAMAGLEKQVAGVKCNVKQYFLAIEHEDKDERNGEKVWPCMEAVFDDLQQRVVGGGDPGLKGRFRRLYAPRSLNRHLLVHKLLFRPGRPAGLAVEEGEDQSRWPHGSGVRLPSEDRHYHYARLCIEIAVAVAKGSGRIDLTGAMQDRIGTYYTEWRKSETGEGRPLRDVCSAEFGLTEEYGFSRTIYALKPEVIAEADGGTITERAANVIVDALFAALRKVEDDAFRDHLADIVKKDMEEVLKRVRKLVGSDAHDIAPTFDLRNLVLMTEPRHAINRSDPRRSVLHTSLSMTARFQEMVRADHWHLLLAISEQGKVVEKLVRSLAAAQRERRRALQAENAVPPADPFPVRKRVSMIVAADPDNVAMDRRLSRFTRWGMILSGAAYRLPFWAHNNHMVIALRMDFDRGSRLNVRWTPVRAIAYRKLALSPKVNPVLVEQPEDLERLVTMYFGYVLKAEKYMDAVRGAAASGVRDVKTFGVPDVRLPEVTRRQEELLDLWWKEMVDDRDIRRAGRSPA